MEQQKEIPVYLFTGFLEAGKTRFILDTMQDENFNDGKRQYLILRCEDGEEEYDPTAFGENVTMTAVEDVQWLTPDRLRAAALRADADVLVVEYNGMWPIDAFYNALPENFLVYQEILIADSTTVLSYNANMRQMTVDKLSSAEMVVFNRVSEATDKLALHKLVRGVSRKANICYEDLTGDITFDDIEDPLPFDLNAPIVDIKDEDFALFYRDMTEDTGKYIGKTLRFKGIVALDPSLGKSEYAIGRHVMVCCADDIAYRGVVARGMGSLKLKTRDWITVTGSLSMEYSPLYRTEGPVLTVKCAERAERPVQEVATFY